jgi:hypothetical protein
MTVDIIIPLRYHYNTMTTKLQIPIDQDVREGLERRARSLGFDSAQAYIRVWAKAEADGRKLDWKPTRSLVRLRCLRLSKTS